MTETQVPDLAHWKRIFKAAARLSFEIGDVVTVSDDDGHGINEGVIVAKDYMPNSWIVADRGGQQHPIRGAHLRKIGSIL